MNKSESIEELAAALSKFQSIMPAVQMNSVNPFLKNRYADLGAMIEAARQPLRECGLAVSQLVTNEAQNIGIETVLMHTSGEWISNSVTLYVGDVKGKSLAQEAGSTITYMRRYSFSAILGLYADEDTDGNAREQGQNRQAQTKPVQKPPQASQPEKVAFQESAQPTSKTAQKRATEPAGGGKPPSLAKSIKTPLWKDVSGAIADEFPDYRMPDGSTNVFHILHALEQEGVTEITAQNVQEMPAVIRQHVANKQAA